MLHEELTKKIIGCAMEVHKQLGNGFQEVIYQRSLNMEMDIARLKFIREMEMPIFYRDIDIGTRRVDFFVEEKIMVELKAVIKLEDVHLAQAMNYLQAYKMEIGLLINFGRQRIKLLASNTTGYSSITTTPTISRLIEGTSFKLPQDLKESISKIYKIRFPNHEWDINDFFEHKIRLD